MASILIKYKWKRNDNCESAKRERDKASVSGMVTKYVKINKSKIKYIHKRLNYRNINVFLMW